MHGWCLLSASRLRSMSAEYYASNLAERGQLITPYQRNEIGSARLQKSMKHGTFLPLLLNYVVKGDHIGDT